MPDSVPPRCVRGLRSYSLLNSASSRRRALVPQCRRSGRPSACTDLDGRTRGVTTGDTSFGTAGDDLE
jgi:hypothetical protein